MSINLYPYNFYILYAAIVLFVIMLVLLAVHGMHLLKALQEKKPLLDHISRNVKLAEIKTEAMKEKKEEDSKKNRLMTLITPFLLAVYEAYKQDPDAKGIRGYKKAAGKVSADRRYLKKLNNAMNLHL